MDNRVTKAAYELMLRRAKRAESLALDRKGEIEALRGEKHILEMELEELREQLERYRGTVGGEALDWMRRFKGMSVVGRVLLAIGLKLPKNHPFRAVWGER